MNSTTTMIAKQCRLQEWTEQIRDCNIRPQGMKVEDWCANHGITKANYYYHLRKVREAYIERVPDHMPDAPIVPVPTKRIDLDDRQSSSSLSGLNISTNGVSVHVTEATSMELLARVLQVIAHAQ